ncbi:hypothetical protein BVX97_04295 [bacterium E08(2017)]|nr:hypothetical protein BVX97_04295 [bacterium E08(2017)]
MDQHFQTDGVKKDLRGLSIRGGTSLAIAQIPTFILNIVSIVVLSRLLEREAFGLIAMVTAVTGLIAIFESMGLTTAVVQHEDMNHKQVSSLFWINLGFCFVLMIITAALAPLLAWFYGRQELFLITIAIAGTRLLGGLTNQHSGILQRQMRFTVLSVINVSSTAVGVLSAIISAIYGLGYWSLVILPAASSLCRVIMLWIITGWIPAMPEKGSGVRAPLKFGWRLTLSRLITHLTEKADYILVGWWCGADALGIYNRAYQLLTLPQQQLKAPISGVATSALSRLTEDKERYSRYYLRVLRSLIWLTAPLTGVLAAVSTDLILLALGSKWLDVALLFKIMAFAAFLRPIQASVGWVLISYNLTDRLRNWVTAMCCVTVLSIVAGLPFGVIGVAISYTIGYLVLIMPWSFFYVFRDTPIRCGDVMKSTAPAVLVGLLIYGAGTLVVRIMPDYHTAIRLLLSLAACAVVLVLIAIVFKPLRQGVKEILELKSEVLKSREA